MLKYIASNKKPALLAIGASSGADVDRAMKTIMPLNEIILMQCNTNYTVDIENFKALNLNVLKYYKNNIKCDFRIVRSYTGK